MNSDQLLAVSMAKQYLGEHETMRKVAEIFDSNVFAVHHNLTKVLPFEDLM